MLSTITETHSLIPPNTSRILLNSVLLPRFLATKSASQHKAEESGAHQDVEEEEEDYVNPRNIDILDQYTHGVSQIEEYIPVSIDKEKQISVDPVSLNQLTNLEGNNNSSSLPSTFAGVAFHALFPPPLIRPKFSSRSLPCSTTSSPQQGATMINSPQKWGNQSHKSHHDLNRQHSWAISNFKKNQEMQLPRSKSCGEGRACAPSDEFDIWPKPPVLLQQEVKATGFPSCIDEIEYAKKVDPNGDESFKCGALCMFLPGFSKGKQVQASKFELEDQGTPVSRVVSLEKFECGSWSSSAIIDGDEDDESMSSYIDLPLELIRNSTNEINSPVKTAFVFERDRKGVLKKNKSILATRKSHESSNRHVRFSTSPPISHPSSPSSFCISPRLQKAREDFNALLEAQGA